MQTHDAPASDRAGRPAALPVLGVWLRIYVAALALLLLHGAELTIASIVIYAHPAAAGLHSFVPLSFLLFYVLANVILIAYIICLFVLIARRRRSAIAHNTVFSVLSVGFLAAWHILGEKSAIGTVIDSVPNIAGAAYFLLSRRVRSTLVIGRRPLSRERPA